MEERKQPLIPCVEQSEPKRDVDDLIFQHEACLTSDR